MHFLNGLADHFLCSSVTAVGKNTDDIFGQWLPRCHDYGCCAHGDAGEDDLNIRTEAAAHEGEPTVAILTFIDTKGDHITFTAAAGTLIYDQGAALQCKATLDTAAQIPIGIATITVEHQLNGGAGGILVVFTPQG